jgi:hypothetical protein
MVSFAPQSLDLHGNRRRYPLNNSGPERRSEALGRGEETLAPATNRTPIPQSFSPLPSHYTDCVILVPVRYQFRSDFNECHLHVSYSFLRNHTMDNLRLHFASSCILLPNNGWGSMSTSVIDNILLV